MSTKRAAAPEQQLQGHQSEREPGPNSQDQRPSRIVDESGADASTERRSNLGGYLVLGLVTFAVFYLVLNVAAAFVGWHVVGWIAGIWIFLGCLVVLWMAGATHE